MNDQRQDLRSNDLHADLDSSPFIERPQTILKNLQRCLNLLLDDPLKTFEDFKNRLNLAVEE